MIATLRARVRKFDWQASSNADPLGGRPLVLAVPLVRLEASCISAPDPPGDFGNAGFVTILVWVLPTLVSGLELGHAETRRAETLGVYPLTADKERALQPKDVFKECDACPQMLVVRQGVS